MIVAGPAFDLAEADGRERDGGLIVHWVPPKQERNKRYERNRGSSYARYP